METKKMGINKCKYCNITIPIGRKFCSISHSAKFNNKPRGVCKSCNTPIPKSNKFCKSCRNSGIKESLDKRSDWLYVTTIKDILSRNKKQPANNYRQIRDHARRFYLKSDKPKKCVICGYDLHFDVCHITGIKDFPENTKIIEVNSLNNLIALCKNHHWEFDNGYITKDTLLCPQLDLNQ